MTEELASETSCNLNTVTKAMNVAQHNIIMNKKALSQAFRGLYLLKSLKGF
jgi:hypothetical protein